MRLDLIVMEMENVLNYKENQAKIVSVKKIGAGNFAMNQERVSMAKLINFKNHVLITAHVILSPVVI